MFFKHFYSAASTCSQNACVWGCLDFHETFCFFAPCMNWLICLRAEFSGVSGYLVWGPSAVCVATVWPDFSTFHSLLCFQFRPPLVAWPSGQSQHNKSSTSPLGLFARPTRLRFFCSGLFFFVFCYCRLLRCGRSGPMTVDNYLPNFNTVTHIIFCENGGKVCQCS